MLPRTILTSVTTMLALIALYIFGGEVLRGFTFTMIWGVIIGTYSSIFIASPVLILLGTVARGTEGGSQGGGGSSQAVTAHYPGRAAIDGYGRGGFSFAQMSHRGSILALPSGIYAWDVDPANLRPEDFAMVLAERAEIDLLLIGMGPAMARPPRNVREAMQAAGLTVDPHGDGSCHLHLQSAAWRTPQSGGSADCRGPCGMSTADDHCRELVRTQDKDRFLAVLFAPEAAQPHLLALYAFNLEVTRIRHVVSDPQIGLIRQQWWPDTIDGIYSGSVPGHPVAEALAAAIAAGNLPKQPLQALVMAHEFDLYADAMPDVTALEAYLGETSSLLIQLAAMILDAKHAPAAAEVAGLAGVAHGLTQILADPARRMQYLPPVMDVAAAIAHAWKRLAEARALRPKLSPTLLPAFLPVSLTGLYLRRIQAAPDQRLAVTQFRRQLTIWYYARRDSF